LLNLDKFLEEFYQDYAFQAKQKGVQFHYDNAIRDWRVLGDSERVRQLLQNLFSNALKFT
jgi:signal transduction histidine kinase